ncbi:hypothetical protein PC129_g14200 [Phytophthora cactorum]|uniref:Uncharacterized protein n=1 Tax=Phytophthora cactorum TaxID=29920 RepID=A0A8T1D0C2_9STRA|nr:hypothetical protein PC117_g12961 [Phytophthora cactorum]KAG3214904.1 hypothetical protein PC129_g14200 [Phytophthora cactorum]
MSSNRTRVTVALKAMPSYSALISIYACAADGSVRLPHPHAIRRHRCARWFSVMASRCLYLYPCTKFLTVISTSRLSKPSTPRSKISTLRLSPFLFSRTRWRRPSGY